MKHQWMAYVIVALLSIGAGVAIAGLPNNVPVNATIVPPTTTERPTPTAPTTEVPETTAAPTTTDGQETTKPGTTEPETTEPETTEPGTTDSVALGISERGELTVVVANGAGIAGTAARNVVRLTELGYTDVTSRDGVETFEFTTIYYADGFEAVALRMANDLQLLPEFVAPLTDAPEVLSLPADLQLLAYIGVDRAR